MTKKLNIDNGLQDW